MTDLAVDLVWLAIALPLLGAVVLHFLGRVIGEPGSGWLASLTTGAAFVVALAASIPFIQGGAEAEQVVLWEWMPAIGATFEILWDPLSSLMTLVVTGVGFLIHVFAIGYMHADDRFPRFFTYLNLFVGSMLTLVLAGNFAMLFLGWELVGLCSYLLISFWYTEPVNAAAGRKAFVVNRIGDFGFMVALMLIFAGFGTLRYEGVLDVAGQVLSEPMATAIGLLLLVGAAGKSAQIPLYVWLPDAMAGPTPVSALIHAATMVTAGVYVIARSASIFELAPVASLVVAGIGALTALWAATIAIAQTDIKRVLAYSTISQLGYMFLGVGLTAYVAGIFHLMTHAFFKALLFLGAGSVIHAVHSQDMRTMGGLRKAMPLTAATMGIATLAIAGIPPLAGFWSKDEILAVAFETGGVAVAFWLIGLITALITAFYMTRQWVLVFMGRPRWGGAEGEEAAEPHESPRVMTVPLVILAALTVVGGLVNTPFFGLGLEHFLEPSFAGLDVAHPSSDIADFLVLSALTTLAGLAGIAMAYLAYNRPRDVWERFQSGFGRLWTAWEDAYGVDDLYGTVLVRPGHRLADVAAFRVDLGVIDALVDGVGRLVAWLGATGRTLQTGFVRNYGVTFLTGLLVVVVWLVARGGGL